MEYEPLATLADFLTRFYHEEPDDVVASTNALQKSAGHYEYRWRIAESFRYVFREDAPSGTLRDLVREHANRFCQSDEQARRFLEETYSSNSFDTALDPADFGDN